MTKEVQENAVTDEELYREIQNILIRFKLQYNKVIIHESLYHTGDGYFMEIFIILPDDKMPEDSVDAVDHFYRETAEPIKQAIADDSFVRKASRERDYYMVNTLFMGDSEFERHKSYWGIR